MTDNSDDDLSGHYWLVEIYGLTKQEARTLLRLSRNELGKAGFVSDPKKFCRFHLDVEGAWELLDALELLSLEDSYALGVREQLEEWVATRPREERGG